jgi:hypothetical protein
MKSSNHVTLRVFALSLVCLAFSSAAQAQMGMQGQLGGIGQGQTGLPLNFPGMLPGGNLNGLPNNQIATPQQMQQMIMMRALQSRGHHHGVQTGYPDPIIQAGPQMSPGDMGYTDSGTSGSTRNGSSEKRAAARAAREQQKALLREKAEAKKASKPAVKNAGKAKGDAF